MSLSSSGWNLKHVTHNHKTHRKLKEHFSRYSSIKKNHKSIENKGIFKSNIDFSYVKLRLNVNVINNLEFQHFKILKNLKNFFPTVTAGFVGVGHIYFQHETRL